jgi:hypothetical protein
LRRLDFVIRAGSFINICNKIFIGFFIRADVFNITVMMEFPSDRCPWPDRIKSAARVITARATVSWAPAGTVRISQISTSASSDRQSRQSAEIHLHRKHYVMFASSTWKEQGAAREFAKKKSLGNIGCRELAPDPSGC